MAKRNALLIPAILCFLATLAFLGLKSMGYVFSAGEHGQTAAGNTPHPSLNESSDQPPQTKRDRHEGGDAKALRELEAEFDEILPAQFPDQPSSLCDATLEPGETLFLGGFGKADGNYEFTMLEAKPVGADGASRKTAGPAPQYKITTRTMSLSREKSSEMGLSSLISPAKTRIQKSIVFPSGETPPLGEITRVMTMPSATTRPDTAATISVGTDDQAYVISFIINPQEDSDSIRLRTRIESPDGFP